MDFHFFSKEEKQPYKHFQTLKDKLLRPFCATLHKYSIKPDLLSYLGFFMVIPFIYFFRFNPWIAFLFLLLNLIFDTMDGPLARYIKKESKWGAFLDHLICDQFSFFAIFLTFLYFGLLNSFWASFYLLNYVLMLAFILYCNNFGIKIFPVVRSKLLIYLAFFIWLLSGNNYFDIFVVFFSVYMVTINSLLIYKIKCSLS